MKYFSVTLLVALLCTVVIASPVDDVLVKFRESDSVNAVVEKVKCLTKAIRDPLQRTHFSNVWSRAESRIKSLSKQFAKCLEEKVLTKKPE